MFVELTSPASNRTPEEFNVVSLDA